MISRAGQLTSGDAAAILEQLALVDAERVQRAAEPGLTERVRALKHYQQRRFVHTYGDLLGTPRYGAASRFFLDELYGPKDYSDRDAQFARVVPALVKLFPQAIIDTVVVLATLHALSERLDTAMGLQLSRESLDGIDYIRAWQAAASPAERERQIGLTLQLGHAMDRLTRNPVLRGSLRMMRGPATAAGLGALQGFLESGFDTFRQMRGADEFLAMIEAREHRLATALFAAPLNGDASGAADALGQLP